MNIDVYSAAGAKVKSMELPASLFEAPANRGLMHQAVVMQQNNRRQSAAHVQTRGEVWGSTKKLFTQKHTGRARRGDVRSPVLRGGGKAFGPRNEKNFIKDMPKKMRHAALRSCLALQASKGAIVGLDTYPNTIKTKEIASLLKKLPIQHGRRVLFVTDGKHEGIQMSVRNIPFVKTVYASYLNPEDVLNARSIIFLADALASADAVFGKKDNGVAYQKRMKQSAEPVPAKAEKKVKKTSTKKSATASAEKKPKTKKASSKSADSSPS